MDIEHDQREKKEIHHKALNEEEKLKLSIRPGIVSWEELQSIAFHEDKEEEKKDDELMHYVLEAQRLKVKLPLVRRVVSNQPFQLGNFPFTFQDGDTIIVDVVRNLVHNLPVLVDSLVRCINSTRRRRAIINYVKTHSAAKRLI